MSPQTTDHLLGECEILRKQIHVLRKSITKASGNWPITNSYLANKYTKFFQIFVNTINSETLKTVNSNKIFLEVVKLTYGHVVNMNFENITRLC
jgi:hypothetical protein